ncbi:MAG: choice-of-anchor D domain-containing protein [Cytophagales bacterium]|nr:MAG: choice-of-anchor D domain-containing protein [Cytophagales bacterium]TAF62058.1 MAG: choice-of-anchor D domain-containing protein [Cytophagales bacterium]
MKKILLSYLLATLLILINFLHLQAQDGHDHLLPLNERRCATMAVDSANRLAISGPVRSHEDQALFEQWLKGIIEENKRRAALSFTLGAVYTIPVVFHIVHNGEAVGTGRNIPYVQVTDQIAVLNEDFRRIVGTAGFNANPVGADSRIEFCLARRRPDGSPFPGGEDGVNRINRTTAGFTAPPHTTGYIDATIKPWTSAVAGSPTRGYATSDYLNIWICQISGGILGYAQFPQTNMTGMPCTPQTVATDGVVFGFNYIGDITKNSTAQLVAGAPYNRGRTATHEVGHWLGLRHIWGDENLCNADDFCADTPMAGPANFGCPVGANTCAAFPGNDQIENYMDYSDDACMNIFTIDQKARMRAVLENSPRRKSLLQSTVCIPPFPNDAAITEVLAPSGMICGTSITPQVTLKNFGTATLTSATINYQLDGGAILTFAWSGSLAVGASTNQLLPVMAGLTDGAHTFRAFSTLPNGVADPNTTMDESQNNFYTGGFTIPYTETFTSETFPPPYWGLINGGQCPTWGSTNVTQISGTTGQAAGEYNFTYNPGIGDVDELITPVINLPAGSTAVALRFDVAHRAYDAATNERLRVQISTDCGATYPSTVYDLTSNTGLATGAALTTLFYPTAAANWRTEVIDISAFASTCASAVDRNIRLKFLLTNAFGNNVYIDNVRITATMPPEISVTESSVNVPDDGAYAFGTTNTGTAITRTFTVNNTGATALNLSGFSVTGTGFTGTAPPASIAAGASGTFTLTFNPTCGSSAAFAGNVTFNTNDCSEAPYNFTLSGSTNACNISALGTGIQTACVPATNTYTQQVTVTYVNPPCTGTLDVNGQSFAITSSPQTVTLTGLTANGLAVNTTASFSATACTRTSAALFTAPAACSAPPACTLTSSDLDNSICVGQSVTFTATGGTNYDFRVNGTSVQNSATATYTTTSLANGDVVSVVVSTSAGTVTVYSENFETGGATWTLNTATGVNGIHNNFWTISDDEGGVAPPGCGVANNADETLHITSFFNPTGGAAYDAGGLCGLLFCPQTNRRAESANINTTGHTGMTLRFNYIANGQGLTDNASVVYFDGTTWSVLTNSIKSTVCPSTQGRWTAYSAALPAAFEGKTNARIGFVWTNNDDGVGTDPSVAINNIVIDRSSAGTPCTPASITMTVTPAPAIPTVSGTLAICAGSNTTVTAASGVASPTFQWYDAASGGTLLASTAAYTTPVLSANTTYYVQVTTGGCTSARTPVNITVSANPSNNNFCNAATAFVGYNSFYSNRCATAQGSEPSTPNTCFRTNSGANPGVSHSVWFRFTSPVTQTYGACIYYGTDAANVSTGGQFDSEMAMYTLTSGSCASNPNFTGAGPIVLAQVACNDDGVMLPAIHGPWGVRSAFNCGSITSGNTVYFQVDGAWRLAGGTKGNRMDAFPGASESDDFVLHIFPITLLDLDWVKVTAKATEKGNLVEWTTANERNTLRYEVQKSATGKPNSFVKVGMVEARGGFNTSYSFLDPQLTAATAYYRIREISSDNNENLSKVVLVSQNTSVGILSLTPNPVETTAELLFAVEEATDVQISIFDALGRLMQTSEMNANAGQNSYIVQTQQLNAGTYTVVLTHNGQRHALKMIKR